MVLVSLVLVLLVHSFFLCSLAQGYSDKRSRLVLLSFVRLFGSGPLAARLSLLALQTMASSGSGGAAARTGREAAGTGGAGPPGIVPGHPAASPPVVEGLFPGTGGAAQRPPGSEEYVSDLFGVAASPMTGTEDQGQGSSPERHPPGGGSPAMKRAKIAGMPVPRIVTEI